METVVHLHKVVSHGTEPFEAPGKTDKCGECTLIRGVALDLKASYLIFAKAKDAALATATAKSRLRVLVDAAWKKAWDEFRCNDPECAEKAPCGERAKYLELGAALIHARGPGPTDEDYYWRVYASVVRDIQCAPKGLGTPDHDQPKKEPGGWWKKGPGKSGTKGKKKPGGKGDAEKGGGEGKKGEDEDEEEEPESGGEMLFNSEARRRARGSRKAPAQRPAKSARRRR